MAAMAAASRLVASMLQRSTSSTRGFAAAAAGAPAYHPDYEGSSIPQMPDFDHTPMPYSGPSKEEVLAMRKQFLSPGVCVFAWGSSAVKVVDRFELIADVCSHTPANPKTAMFTHFKEPVMIVEGKMQYLFDERGRRYLDVSI